MDALRSRINETILFRKVAMFQLVENVRDTCSNQSKRLRSQGSSYLRTVSSQCGNLGALASVRWFCFSFFSYFPQNFLGCHPLYTQLQHKGIHKRKTGFLLLGFVYTLLCLPRVNRRNGLLSFSNLVCFPN